MENNINIAELLKECPKGMELDCTMFENVTFEGIKQDEYPIIVKIKESPMTLSLTKTGGWNLYNSAKCVIYPKGKTTWEDFVPPGKFKDGDVAISDFGDIHILRTKDSSYCAYRTRWTGLSKLDTIITTGVKVVRLATEAEKQILFDSIKANGYKWNEETKTLEKLINKNKFVIGAVVTNGKIKGKIWLKDGDSYVLEDNTHIFFNEVHNWELVPDKFDISTLKPFDKVLVRDCNDENWVINWYGYYNKEDNSFRCIGNCDVGWEQCVPYENNEHLLGTTDACDEYFKTWE